MGTIIGMIVIGLIAGGLARLLVPGRDPMGCLGTMLLGIVGSFVGGFLHSLLWHGDATFRTSGLIGSVIGGIVVLVLVRMTSKRKSSL